MIRHAKKTRLIDIAHRLGVSKATVAAVLSAGGSGTVRFSEEIAEKIRRTAREMDYQPNISAKTLAGRASKVIGILIDAEAPYPRFKILAEIEREATLRGYRCMIGEAHDSLENLRRNYDIFMQHGVDGVVCLSHDYPGTEEEFKRLFSDTLDKVVFIDAPNHPDASYINIDRAASTYQTVRHLHEQGARKIAFVRGQSLWKTTLQHEAGYRRAMVDLGYPERELHIITTRSDLIQQREVSEESISRFIEHDVIPEKIDGIIGMNDLVSLAFFKALEAAGKSCPRDIMIVGYDNEKFSRYTAPALTTVDENYELQSKMIVDLLLEKINHPEKEMKGCFATVVPQLIIRESTRKNKKRKVSNEDKA